VVLRRPEIDHVSTSRSRRPSLSHPPVKMGAMPDRAPDRAIDGLARRQHGAFHRRQAVRAGFTRSMIRTRLSNGSWVQLAQSEVFALPSHPHSWQRQCMAATLSVPASGVAGPAAAALLGFPDWPRGRIEVVTRRGTTTRSPFARVRRWSHPGRLVVVEGIRVVSPADCLLQLAPSVDASRLGRLVDDIAIARPGVLDELRDRYASLARSKVPGLARVRAVLDERGPGFVPPASELERLLRDVLAGVPGLPPVVWEAPAPWSATERVDALVPEWALVVEGDGRAWHTRVADFERDRERDALALAHGHVTLRFTWHQLTRRPAWCRTVISAVGVRRWCTGGADRAA
jgi:hypothetical protein